MPRNTSYCSISGQYDRKSKALTTHPIHHIESFFEASRNEWEASEPCHQLRSLLMSTPVPYHVSRIVAFACASLAVKKPEDLSRRQAYQHALILTLRDILHDKQGGMREISCFAQDPAYTTKDDKILKDHGITILEHPGGFLEVDDATVVLSFAPEVCVKQVVVDIAQPPLIIWGTLLPADPEREIT